MINPNKVFVVIHSMVHGISIVSIHLLKENAVISAQKLVNKSSNYVLCGENKWRIPFDIDKNEVYVRQYDLK